MNSVKGSAGPHEVVVEKFHRSSLRNPIQATQTASRLKVTRTQAPGLPDQNVSFAGSRPSGARFAANSGDVTSWRRPVVSPSVCINHG